MEEFNLKLWFQNNFVIIFFVVIQVVFLIYAWIRLTTRKEWHFHTNTWASILTVFGVFGTFLGIYLGLLDFDHKNIEGSIPGLLDGLKHAFLTSLLGIFSAIILKWNGLRQAQNSGDPNEEMIRNLGIEIKTALEPLMKSGEINLSSQFDDLITALKEDNRTTRDVLLGMRTDLTEGQIKSLTQLETLTNSCEKQSELLNGVIPLLTTIQDSLTNEEIGVIAKLEVLTTTVSEKQDALLNGVKDALTPIQTSLADEQASVLTKLEVLTTTVSEKQDALLNGVKDALTPIQTSLADEQAGVLAKLETLTATVSDEHDKLRTEFETFSNNVAESITKLATNELISALSDVIEKFNAKITEQFGDNFKQLNEAVGKTVEWQQQYREQMNELAEEFLLVLEGIEKSQNALENIANSSSAIVERSDSIVTCAEKLEPILHTMNDQLEAFSNLRQNAEDSLPTINNNLEELTTKFSSTVENAIADSKTSMETQREAFSEQSDQLKSVIDGLGGFTTQIDGITQNVLSTVDNLRESMDLQKNISEDLMQRFVSMQSTLEQELTESINTLAGKLAALSEKFVEDYTPLTERLREVIMIAERDRPRGPKF